MPTIHPSILAATALALSLLGGTACKKSEQPSAASAPPLAERGPAAGAVDTRTLTAPALFAHIPADAPYVVAAFEAVPLAYYAKLKHLFAPLASKMMEQARADGEDPLSDPMFAAVVHELDGKWSAAGLETLGLSATPRFALYGLGLFPVFRIEVRDEKLVLATVERIAARAGKTLPPPTTVGGQAFWRIPGRDADILVALADRQLVAAVGPAAQLDASLGLILGSEKPAASMSDGARLKQVIAKHGFGPHVVGYVDTKRVLDSALALPGAPPQGPCTTELAHLTTRVPGMAFGYGEFTATRVSGGAVLELAGDLLAELGTLQTSVPGYAAAMAGDPLLAIGGGVDLAKARTLGGALAATLRRIGTACETTDTVEAADEFAALMARPLPEAITAIAGGALVARSVTFEPGNPIPTAVDAVAFISSPQAKQLFGLLGSLLPPLAQLGLVADGKLHAITNDKLPLPYTVSVGISDTAIAVAVGGAGTQLAQQALAPGQGTPVPLLAVSFDYGGLLGLQGQFQSAAGTGPMEAEMLRAMAALFGRSTATIEVRPAGLAMWGVIEMQ